MHRAQTLTKLFRQLADLVSEEAETNPAFASKLEAILAPIPGGALSKPKSKAVSAPDVFTEFEARGSEEFSFWLRTLDIATLKTIIKVNGFDPGKTSVRWKESDKFIPLITEQVAARLKRGSAFLSPSRASEVRLAQNPAAEYEKPQG